MKFRYYLVNDEGTVEGTDSMAAAEAWATNEYTVVIDSETGKQLLENRESVEIEEQELYKL